MIFLNTIKLTIANFYISWRVTIYKAIALILCAALGISIIAPIIADINEAFKEQLVWEVLKKVMDNDYGTFAALAADFYNNFLVKGTNIIYSEVNGIGFWFSVIGLLLLFCLGKFLLALSDLSVTKSIDGYMSSLQEEAFLAGFFSTLKRSVRYAGFHTLTVLFDIVIAVAAFYIAGIIVVVQSVVVIFLFLAFILGAYSLKKTLFACLAPSLVREANKTMWQTFVESIKKMKWCFYKIWFSAFNLYLVLFVINYIAAYFLGVGLILTIPATFVAIKAFDLVAYYTVHKLKFYVSPTVITQTFRDQIDGVDQDAFY